MASLHKKNIMSTKNKISLKKLPEFNTVWHEESALVFKSAKELVIVGKLVNKKRIIYTQWELYRETIDCYIPRIEWNECPTISSG